MPAGVAAMSDAEKLRLVRNHISITTIFSRNLARLSTVGTMAGKYLTVGSASGTYTIDGIAISEMDRVFENGVVHRVSEWLAPRKNLYQWLEEAATTIRGSAIRCWPITSGSSTRRTVRFSAWTRTAGSSTTRCGSSRTTC